MTKVKLILIGFILGVSFCYTFSLDLGWYDAGRKLITTVGEPHHMPTETEQAEMWVKINNKGVTGWNNMQ